MKVFRGLPNDRARAPCALTIGNFDGVHRGHQALLERVRSAAAGLGIEAAVMTFEPHPPASPACATSCSRSTMPASTA
jgi:riboflavin kinase / FMN adenylyltransferase